MISARKPTMWAAIAVVALLVGPGPATDDATAGETSVEVMEANKEVIRRFVWAGKNRNDPAALGEIFAADIKHHAHMPQETLPAGAAGLERVGEIYGIAFPKISVVIEFLLADGDFVFERSTVEAVHGGPFAGISATGKAVTWTENHLYRLVDGRIAEVWPEADIQGLIEQIGGSQ